MGVKIPLLHIAEATAVAIHKKGLKSVALLGTKYTMELDFFKDKLKSLGINTLIPDLYDRDLIHTAIYNELGKGLLLPETKSMFLNIMAGLKESGAEAIILGCTEIPLLVSQTDFDLPLFDTTLIHATAAVEFALS